MNDTKASTSQPSDLGIDSAGKRKIEFNGTHYDVATLVKHSAAYPPIEVERKYLVTDLDQVCISAKSDQPVIVSYNGEYQILVANSEVLTKLASASGDTKITCRLATKYALKKVCAVLEPVYAEQSRNMFSLEQRGRVTRSQNGYQNSNPRYGNNPGRSYDRPFKKNP